MNNKETFNTIKEYVTPKGINPYFTYAVGMVESNCTFTKNNKPVVRFEKAVFKKYLKKHGYTQLIGQADNLTSTGYNTYINASNIHKTYAMLSTSFGMFQIMGFNFASAGYPTVVDFVAAMHVNSLDNQLKAFCTFVQKTNLVRFMNTENFSKFASQYNGPNYRINSYDVKLLKFYEQAKGLDCD